MQEDRNIWEKLTIKNNIIGKDSCPFCKIEESEKPLLIWNNKYWEIRYNKFPYGGIREHILVFPKRHVEFTKDLNKNEFSGLKEVENFIYNFYENKQYFCFLRETFKGRSIKHLHYHYLPGNIHGSEFAKILKKQGLTNKK